MRKHTCNTHCCCTRLLARLGLPVRLRGAELLRVLVLGVLQARLERHRGLLGRLLRRLLGSAQLRLRLGLRRSSSLRSSARLAG